MLYPKLTGKFIYEQCFSDKIQKKVFVMRDIDAKNYFDVDIDSKTHFPTEESIKNREERASWAEGDIVKINWSTNPKKLNIVSVQIVASKFAVLLNFSDLNPAQ